MNSSFRVDDVRGASSRNRPDPSASACPITAWCCASSRATLADSLVRAEATTIAPGTGLPSGSRTRPITNIRPGAGFGAGSSGRAAAGDWRLTARRLGSSFLA